MCPRTNGDNNDEEQQQQQQQQHQQQHHQQQQKLTKNLLMSRPNGSPTKRFGTGGGAAAGVGAAGGAPVAGGGGGGSPSKPSTPTKQTMMTPWMKRRMTLSYPIVTMLVLGSFLLGGLVTEQLSPKGNATIISPGTGVATGAGNNNDNSNANGNGKGKGFDTMPYSVSKISVVNSDDEDDRHDDNDDDEEEQGEKEKQGDHKKKKRKDKKKKEQEEKEKEEDVEDEKDGHNRDNDDDDNNENENKNKKEYGDVTEMEMEMKTTKKTMERPVPGVTVEGIPPNLPFDEDGSWPKIAWLMSFPNSGTSYTGKFVAGTTQTSRGTNYGSKNLNRSGSSSPIFDDAPDGPFWADPRRMNDPTRKDYLGPPSHYIITKTHCGSRCERCSPDRYAESPHSFFHQCLQGRKAATTTTATTKSNSDDDSSSERRNDDDGGDGRHDHDHDHDHDHHDEDEGGDEEESEEEESEEEESEEAGVEISDVFYSPDLVKRMIHLIRNPFDNIVSRYHLEQHELIKREGVEMPLTVEGFRAFCKNLNDAYAHDEHESRFWRRDVRLALRYVPCRADFFRYVQWHNLAFVTTDMYMHDRPTMILHYESFDTHFNETADAILQFLKLERKGKTPVFVKGKNYAMEYFTSKERRAVKTAMRMMSLPKTWEYIQHYFDDDDDDDENDE